MIALVRVALFAVAVVAVTHATPPVAPACCPAPPSGKPVVNADQTVIIVWDANTKTQHFIRQASFKSEADDFGFLVPTPDRPELDESGDAAFTHLRKLTEPERQKMARPSGGIGCGCSAALDHAPKGAAPPVSVLEEKTVAGFQATVLEADSADALVKWLKDHGYAFSPEVEAWARPYVGAGWKITALRVAKDKGTAADKDVAAAALRMSFRTERPLFPYREPDPKAPSENLGVKNRLLRIYFLAEGRYEGELTRDQPWTGQVAWANKLSAADRQRTLELLRLPPSTGPAEWWLTEFEDPWPYRAAPADVYFRPGSDQSPVSRPPVIEYVSSPGQPDVMVLALGAVLAASLVLRWRRAGRD